jgi:hypothetical protein
MEDKFGRFRSPVKGVSAKTAGFSRSFQADRLEGLMQKRMALSAGERSECKIGVFP